MGYDNAKTSHEYTPKLAEVKKTNDVTTQTLEQSTELAKTIEYPKEFEARVKKNEVLINNLFHLPTGNNDTPAAINFEYKQFAKKTPVEKIKIVRAIQEAINAHLHGAKSKKDAKNIMPNITNNDLNTLLDVDGAFGKQTERQLIKVIPSRKIEFTDAEVIAVNTAEDALNEMTFTEEEIASYNKAKQADTLTTVDTLMAPLTNESTPAAFKQIIDSETEEDRQTEEDRELAEANSEANEEDSRDLQDMDMAAQKLKREEQKYASDQAYSDMAEDIISTKEDEPSDEMIFTKEEIDDYNKAKKIQNENIANEFKNKYDPPKPSTPKTFAETAKQIEQDERDQKELLQIMDYIKNHNDGDKS